MDLAELEARAREVLPQQAYDYFAGGADDERTLGDNVAAWARIRLRPRVLRDVSHVDLTTTVLGAQVSMPLFVAPVALQRMAHADGECATARAAARAGTLMAVSTIATTACEDVAAAAPDGLRWFQVYVTQDRSFTEDLIDRVVACGYRALALTVDTPVLGRRLRDLRNAFALPDGLALENFSATAGSHEALAAFASGAFDRALTPDDLGWLAERSGLPVLAKGVLRGDDARRCVDAGAAGIVVSNHGGRQLDDAIATADALRDVVDLVAGDAEVYVDGGIRRGADVLKACAMGARGAFVGRPVLWGLAGGDGERGVLDVLEGLRAELRLAMVLAGVPTVADLTPDLLA